MKPTRIISVIILTSFYLIMTPHAVSNSRKESSGSDLLRVTDLRCEYLVNPLGIDELRPRLGWRFESDQRGQKQTAYQLLVASSPEKLKRNNGDLWDTGKVQSDQSIHHIYAGKPMESGMHSYWKVMIWDENGRVTKAASSSSPRSCLRRLEAGVSACWLRSVPSVTGWVPSPFHSSNQPCASDPPLTSRSKRCASVPK